MIAFPADDDHPADHPADAVYSPANSGRWAARGEITAGDRRIAIAAVTDMGKSRSVNEDAFALVPSLGLAIVVDGMGGSCAGVFAARIAIDVTISELAAASGEPDPNRLVAALRAASRAIYRQGMADQELRGMGATAIAALFRDDICTVAHAGDCRGYLARDGGLMAITRDHNLANMMRDAGRAEAEVGPHGHIVTRGLGFREDGEDADVCTVLLAPGDRVILCSDGVHRPIAPDHPHPPDLAPIVTGDASAIAEAAVALGVARGNDNATAVVADVQAAAFPAAGGFA